MKILSFAVLGLVCLVSGLALATDDGTDCSLETNPGAAGTDAYGDAWLTTLFAWNNGFAGNSFDVFASTAITIVGFDVNLAVGEPSHTIDVWMRDGTADGFELSASGWTLLGSDVVVPAGADLPTHVDVGGLFMDSGDTVGFIITTQENDDIMYTNGGPNDYSNADIAIRTFRGLSGGFPPGGAFTYRAWNGTVHYLYGTALVRDTWGTIKSTF